jgi:hypothetical protein
VPLTLHGGGQGFESPRLHSKNMPFYSINVDITEGLDSDPVPFDSDANRLQKGVLHCRSCLISHVRQDVAVGAEGDGYGGVT